MEGTAVRRYWAHIVELCCRIRSSLKITSSTYDLRAMVQLPVVGTRLSGPHRPPVRHVPFERQSNVSEKNIRRLIKKGHSK